MISLLFTLVIIGIALYFVERLPLDPDVRVFIRVVVILFILLYLLRMFGFGDVPFSHIRAGL